MFNTSDVGRKIASLRKERNMTQMELADMLGVSYQAVSNWERGNSMPDISKLPELVEFLGCSIDGLLCNGEKSKLVEHIIKGDSNKYVREEKITIQDIADTAPLLKPSQTENLLDTIIKENIDNNEIKKFNIKDLIAIAPFVGEEYLDELAKQVDVIENMKVLIGLAPFLSKKTLDELANRTIEVGRIRDIVGLAPYLSKDTLDSIVKKCVDIENIKEVICLAPFLRKDTLNSIVRDCTDKGSLKDLTGLAPFLSKDTLDDLVTKAVEDGKIEQCASLYPFLRKKTLQKLADELVKTHGFKGIASMMPFLD